MTNSLRTREGITTLEPIDLDVTVNDYLGQPLRSYCFNKGDRRFRDHEIALRHANSEASRTGIRQVVRPDVDSLGGALFLVQAVGS